MDDDYDVPGRAFSYGPGREVNDGDRSFLEGLDSRYWRVMSSDRRRRYPNGRLTFRELHTVVNLILECRLPTSLGSEMFGLPGYSMAIFDPNDARGQMAGKPDMILLLMGSHMPWADEMVASTHQRTWIFFTGFTHSPENLVLLDYLKVERPGPRERYDR